MKKKLWLGLSIIVASTAAVFCLARRESFENLTTGGTPLSLADVNAKITAKKPVWFPPIEAGSRQAFGWRLNRPKASVAAELLKHHLSPMDSSSVESWGKLTRSFGSKSEYGRPGIRTYVIEIGTQTADRKPVKIQTRRGEFSSYGQDCYFVIVEEGGVAGVWNRAISRLWRT